MGVKVVLLDAEGSGHLATLIYLVGSEHSASIEVLNDVVGLGIGQVAALVDWVSLFVVFAAVLVLKHHYVAFLITVQVTQHIVFVESPQVSIGRNSN
jgi:hypothetical protein